MLRGQPNAACSPHLRSQPNRFRSYCHGPRYTPYFPSPIAEPAKYANRLHYYNCKNYTRQIREGDGYGELRPSISICLLSRKMFWQKPDTARWHHSFRLRCDQNVDLILTNDLEFHIIELPNMSLRAIISKSCHPTRNGSTCSSIRLRWNRRH